MAFVTEQEMAKELADKSPNLNKGLHPVNVPDGMARENMFGAETTGMDTADWGKSDEERDEETEQGNIAELHTRNLPLSNSEGSKRRSKKSVQPEGQKRTVLSRGGGESGVDLLFSDWANADQEMVHTYLSFVKEEGLTLPKDRGEIQSLVPQGMSESKAKERFAMALSGDLENLRTEERAGREGVPLKLERLNAETVVGRETAEDMFSLVTAWGKKDTRVVYRVSSDKNIPDTLTFKFTTKKEQAVVHEQVAISVDAFNMALDKSDIRMRIRRPWKGPGSEKAFIGVLRNLRLGQGTFKGEKVSVEFPQKKKQEGKAKPEKSKRVEVAREADGFNLRLNSAELDRLTKDVVGFGAEEAKKNREEVSDFVYFVTSEPENIDGLLFVTDPDRQKIKSVVLQVNDRPKGVKEGDKDNYVRRSITIPLHIFYRVMSGGDKNGIEPYHKFGKRENEVVGLRFNTRPGEGGKPVWREVHPKTNEAWLDDVKKRLRIEGKALPASVHIGIGPEGTPVFDNQPQAEETG